MPAIGLAVVLRMIAQYCSRVVQDNLLSMVAARLWLKRITMKQCRGIWLPNSDTHFAEHLEKGPAYRGAGTYQMKKILLAMQVVKQHTSDKGVALDIGAHVGLWSRYLVDHFPTVIAFEPVPNHVECFKANLAKELRADPHNSRVILYQHALGNGDGEILIETTPDNSGNAHVSAPGAKVNGHGVLVPLRKLDDYVLAGHSISFIKVDVEGFELDVLKGGEQTIKREKPVMVIEQKPGHGRRYGLKDTAAVDLMKQWGASVAWEKSGDFCMYWK